MWNIAWSGARGSEGDPTKVVVVEAGVWGGGGERGPWPINGGRAKALAIKKNRSGRNSCREVMRSEGLGKEYMARKKECGIHMVKAR